MKEEIILVNEHDEVIGTMEKIEAHQKALLHRAFSVFIFNVRNEMLLQRRANGKYHSGGLWTNTCCSHPRPGENTKDAAARRLFEEMGFTTTLEEIFHFTYKHAFENNLTEFEFDHVFAGYYDGEIYPNKEEASDYCFMNINDIESSLTTHPAKFSAWFHIAFPLIKKWLQSSDKLQTAKS
ncbi:MAG TPA: isopentenyl-diphosphate Delta-isomerase [Puia sp.]|nr:isopentenyl-diphosphate Delta-isomerase [Puia sp.]